MSLLPHGHQSGMFIEAPLGAVSDCLVRWGNEEKVNIGTQAEQAKMSLEQASQHVAQRAFTPNRAVLIPIGGWTAFFDNHTNEWLAAAELHILCERLRAKTCFFLYEDRPERGEHRGSAQFNHCRYGGGDFPVKERQVMLLKESGWRFQQSGDPLPFEDLEAYQRPKKRDRLTPDLLRAYGAALDIPFWDPDAYGQGVVLLRWGKKPHDTDSALKEVMQIFGRPSLIMDRHGVRRPPE